MKAQTSGASDAAPWGTACLGGPSCPRVCHYSPNTITSGTSYWQILRYMVLTECPCVADRSGLVTPVASPGGCLACAAVLGAGCSPALHRCRGRNLLTDSHCCSEGVIGAIQAMLILRVLQSAEGTSVSSNCSIDLLSIYFYKWPGWISAC